MSSQVFDSWYFYCIVWYLLLHFCCKFQRLLYVQTRVNLSLNKSFNLPTALNRLLCLYKMLLSFNCMKFYCIANLVFVNRLRVIKFDRSFRAIKISVSGTWSRSLLFFIAFTVLTSNFPSYVLQNLLKTIRKDILGSLQTFKKSHWKNYRLGTWSKIATKYHLYVLWKIDSYRANVNHVEPNHEIWTWPYIVLFKYFELFSIS